ncbi:hypothetical protein CDV36_004482 [Fusarium kuroshium]|uniref:Uncharacterized protein n=1 Tax=Fusarium kuroshium TaxID=2010991 RepID=A0A3M2SE58_9HYPO|nr:hypothetical protein CDV36_004482 [Fusarium kuroshium]
MSATRPEHEFSRKCDSEKLIFRWKKRGNNAALIEMDLDTILRANHSVTDLTSEAFENMDNAALDLLRSLNIMANLQLITNERPSTNPDATPNPAEPTDSRLADLQAGFDEFARLGADFRRLHRLMSFLASPSALDDQREFRLATGTHPLFVLPPEDTGDLAISHLRTWNEIIGTLAGRPQTVSDCSFVPLEAMVESTGQETWNERRGERVTSVIEAIFNEFRRLDCVKKTTHEIRLHVSSDLYTGRQVYQHNLDMFISCCPASTLIWQNSQCGSFPNSDAVKKRICDSISQAMHSRRKLHILVDSEGLFDVTESLPIVHLPCDSFDGTSFGKLLEQDIFGPIDTQAYLNKTAASKVDSATKAQVALGLSRCLMDFFDKGLELASYSWVAENVHFRESSICSKEGKERLLYVSLRPNLYQDPRSDMDRMFHGGNPVALSFAKLLLEILDGKTIDIQIKPDDDENIPIWSDLEDIVEELLHNRGAEPFASEYLKVVGSCLNLWATLRNLDNRTDPLTTSRFVRKTIYEKMVHKLELLASSEQAKHRRLGAIARDGQGKRKHPSSLFGESPSKRLTLLPLYQDTPSVPSCSNAQSPNATVSDSDEETTVEEGFSEEDSGEASLYDEQKEADQSDRKTAKRFLRDLNQGFGWYIKPLKDRAPNEMEPIKVAILDSGVNLNDPAIKHRRHQIEDTRNWTSDQPYECDDACGHGTHVTWLILKAAPAVKVYVAKVFEKKKGDSNVFGQIAQVSLKAIEWATKMWKVDIISLSLGMDVQDETVRKALDEILYPPRDTPEVVVIAAASNSGGNEDVAFPACYKDIVCIHSTDGLGNPSKKNPTPYKGKDLAVLGMSIESGSKDKDEDKAKAYISGTSFAAAIGAGIAANILEFARRDPEMRDRERWLLFSSWGMSRVLRSMSSKRGGYRYVRPWKLFDGRPEKEIWSEIRGALKEHA